MTANGQVGPRIASMLNRVYILGQATRASKMESGTPKCKTIFSLLMVVMLCSACDNSSEEFDDVEVGRSGSVNSGEPRSDWDDMSSDSLLAHIRRANGTAIIGLSMPGRAGVQNGQSATPAHVIDVFFRRTGSAANINYEVLYRYSEIPALLIRIEDVETIERLRSHPHVEYLEPNGGLMNAEGEGDGLLRGIAAGSTTCGYDSPSGTHVFQLASGDVIYSPFVDLGVASAWNVSTGSGVKIGVLGTGVSSISPQLNSQFNSTSPGRYILRRSEHDGGISPAWDDTCGHETKVISVIAAPRDGISMAGIAFDSNIISTKTDDDVILGNALFPIADGDGDIHQFVRGLSGMIVENSYNKVDIVSMALGSRYIFDSVRDVIETAYARGVMLIAAAGTPADPLCNDDSTPLFPADMTEVIAAAAMKSDGNVQCGDTDISNPARRVDFAIPEDGQFSLRSDNYYNQITKFKSSSSATASLTGMFALLLGAGYSREQALARMLASRTVYNGSPAYANEPRIPNVDHAIGLVQRASISGPTILGSNGFGSFTANQENAPASANISYSWSGGQSGKTVTVPVSRSGGPNKSYTLSVVVTQSDPTWTETIQPSATANFNYSVAGLMSGLNATSCVSRGTTSRFQSPLITSGSLPFTHSIQTRIPCDEGARGGGGAGFVPNCGQWGSVSSTTIPGTNTVYYDLDPASLPAHVQSFEVRSNIVDPEVSYSSGLQQVYIESSCNIGTIEL